MRAFQSKSEPADPVKLRLTVLGTRGSMAVICRNRELFGCATSCYLVQAGEDCVFLDAGSGLAAAPPELPGTPLILLSHLHLDHVMGLGLYPRLFRRGTRTGLCIPTEEGQEAASLLDGLFSPPWWPIRMTDYGDGLEIAPMRLPMKKGRLLIEGIPGNHPGGCMVFRISFGGKSLVYATDYEHTEPSFTRLAEFAHGTDLLLYDAQFSKDEYVRRKGFGHSTPEKGIELMERCGAKRLLLIHHDPMSTDQALLERERRIGRAEIRFAREGDIIEL